MRNLIAVIFLSVILVGCATAGDHRREVQDDTGDRLTVGTVQKEIRVGISGAADLPPVIVPFAVLEFAHNFVVV